MRRTTRLLWPSLLCGLLAGQAAFAVGSINATLDKRQVTVGEPFTYTVTMIIPQGATADLPGEKATFNRLEVRDYQPTQTPQPDGAQQIVLKYTLVSFDVGVMGLKDFKVPVTKADKSVESYRAPPLEITVASVLPQKGQVQPRGFYGPIMLKSPWAEWLQAGLIALAILAAAALLLWLFRRRRRQAPEAAVEEIVRPDEAALRALRRLAKERVVARGDMLTFYLRLDEILRAWLEARFEIPALERTTLGIMYHLRVRRDSDDWRGDYLALLRAGDRVKFAKSVPTDDEAYADVARAEQVIERARPPAPVAEAEEATAS